MGDLRIDEDPPGWPVLMDGGKVVASSPQVSELEALVDRAQHVGERPWVWIGDLPEPAPVDPGPVE